MSERQYNFIFSKLVQKPDDIIGLLAYSIYKNDKIEYIKTFIKNHDGKEPSEDDIANFHEMHSSQTSINNYMELAKNRMSNVMFQIVQDRLDDFKEAKKKAYAEALADLKPTFLSRCLDGIVGNLCFILFTFGLLVLAGVISNNPAEKIVEWLMSLSH